MEPREQVTLASRLQTKLLERFEKLLDADELSPTDAATLARLLSQNGWTFNTKDLPQGLRSKLTKEVDPALLEDDVIGRIA